MTRNAAFWTALAGFTLIPGLALGWIRNKLGARVRWSVRDELRKKGVELSEADLESLIEQLDRNPGAALEADSNVATREIKERHAKMLAANKKAVRFYFFIVVALALISAISFYTLWPG